jgi:hypothetical protein
VNIVRSSTAPAGGRHFFGYIFGPGPDQAGSLGLTTREGIGLGATVAELKATYGERLSTEDNAVVGSMWQIEGDVYFGGRLTGLAADDVVTIIQGGIQCPE